MAIINNSDLTQNTPIEHVFDTTIPEDSVLASIKATCPKHGDVTAATLFTTYTTIDKNGKAIQHQNMFCIQCLSEYLQELQQQGKIQTLELTRIYSKKEQEQEQEQEQKPEKATEQTN
jgi:hypothetical protein